MEQRFRLKTTRKTAFSAVLTAACVAGLLVIASANADDASKIVQTTPLSANFDRLSAGAKAGDAKMASMLFDQSRECLASKRISAAMTGWQNDKNWILNNSAYFKSNDPKIVAEQQKLLADIEASLDRVDNASDLCRGLGAQLSDGQIYDIARRAGELGDESATACYINAVWDVPDSKLTPKDGTMYRDAAVRLGAQGIAQGSWKVLQAMANAASGLGHGGYSAYGYLADPAAQLRYTMLLRRGVPSNTEDAKQLDDRISVLKTSLAPDVVASGEEWAQKMYTNVYINKGYATPSLSTCNF